MNFYSLRFQQNPTVIITANQPHPKTSHPAFAKSATPRASGLLWHVHSDGRVSKVLEEAGLTDDTIVIHTSDHGEQLGEHGMWWKHTFYESSIGVPLVMAGPGVAQESEIQSNASFVGYLIAISNGGFSDKSTFEEYLITL